jgi:AraC-like DNA-binding protein
MKVVYHQVQQPREESFRVLEVTGGNHPCSWHFHPEYQLGLLLEGSGHRIVGDNMAPLEHGDVSLLGPNLPHVWQFEAERVRAIIVYFREDSFGEGFFDRPEAAAIRRLLNRSTVGLAVCGKTRREVAALLQTLAAQQGMARVITLLSILDVLSISHEIANISSAGFLEKMPDQEGERLRQICQRIQDHLSEALSRDDAAAHARMSPAAFSRFFKARTGKTFQDFVCELRIGRACRLLGEPEMNITEIALASGFENVSSFNRAFRRLRELSPSDYRKKVRALAEVSPRKQA